MEFAASGFWLYCSEDCTSTPSIPSDKNLLEISDHIIAFVLSGNVTGTGGELNIRFTGSLTSCPNISLFGVQPSACMYRRPISHGQKR